MQEYEILKSRIQMARVAVLKNRAAAKEARMAKIREARLAVLAMEQQMANIPSLGLLAYPPPPTDLTQEGIEPNP